MNTTSFYADKSARTFIIRTDITPAEFRADLVVKALEYLKQDLGQPLEAREWDYDGSVNYSAICEYLGWPDLQDGGIFEQAIDQAIKVMEWVEYMK